jgi:chromate transporter
VASESKSEQTRSSAVEVLLVFLRLGCSSFGGPVAHMGYFRKEFVERRRWVNEGTYAELLAVAHALPGPGSSQVGFAVGLLRGGWRGGLAAWVGFTLPSAVLMVAIAYGSALWASPAGARVFHGLQLVAVAVVAQAVVAMQRTLAPDWKRLLLAAAAMATVLLVPWSSVNLLVIVLAGLAGLALFRGRRFAGTGEAEIALSRSRGAVAASVFFVLLALGFVLRLSAQPLLAEFAAFYRSGALVFGGGHVVLPLLEHAIVDRGWVSQPTFLAGYGAAQAMPGPLFTFAAYLGAAMAPAPQRVLYAAVGLAGIFIPGLLAMAAVLPFWGKLRGNAKLQAALLGVNASVVGILAAALVHPLWTSTVHSWRDVATAVAAFLLLNVRRVQPWMVVLAVAVVVFFLH